LLAALSLLFPPRAQSAEDVKKEYKRVQDEIKAQKEKISNAKRMEGTTLDEIDRTNRQLAVVEKKLRSYGERIEAAKRDIVRVKAEVAALQADIDSRKDWMKRKLRAMYKYGRASDTVLVILAADNFSEFLRRWKYLEVLTSYEREAVEEFRKALAALAEKQASLDGLYAQLKKDEEKALEARGILSMKKKQKAAILASVQKERDAYERMLRDLKKTSSDLLEIIKESERAKFLQKGFRNLKGAFQWPVEGTVAVPYGSQEDPRFKTPIFRNGIYIASPEGATARAIYSGKVVFAEWFKGYGQLVIVNHGEGYHSLYANLSEIFLRTGDIIESNREIGRVGDSSMFNKPALYFEIRYNGKPLNPVQWLKKR
jgi:septal ring factor EnvC (AmiA/AmiB activator)